jgi:hypothetical protein
MLSNVLGTERREFVFTSEESELADSFVMRPSATILFSWLTSPKPWKILTKVCKERMKMFLLVLIKLTLLRETFGCRNKKRTKLKCLSS